MLYYKRAGEKFHSLNSDQNIKGKILTYVLADFWLDYFVYLLLYVTVKFQSYMMAYKGETITRVNGNISFFAGKRLKKFLMCKRSRLTILTKGSNNCILVHALGMHYSKRWQKLSFSVWNYTVSAKHIKWTSTIVYFSLYSNMYD